MYENLPNCYFYCLDLILHQINLFDIKKLIKTMNFSALIVHKMNKSEHQNEQTRFLMRVY